MGVIYLALLLFFIVTNLIFLNPLKQPLSKSPNYNEIKRDLKIGELNFLHTTDTHGWISGHINQREYSGDFGDYYSFIVNMREKVAKSGGDLIIVDTGDRHDGQGLSDLTKPNGKYSNEIFQEIPYDLITVGNHELYVEEVSKFEYYNLVKYYGDKFISSNVEFLNDENEWVVFGNDRYRYFTTPINNKRVLALSFLFEFKGGNNRVRVIDIREIINCLWFKNLMIEFSNKVDIIVLFGHIPISHEWEEIWDLQRKIREYYPDTMIQLFGGHSHIRDFSIFDNKSTGLQSGRYCETIGFLSTEDLNKPILEDNNLFRSYIDFNLYSFEYHTDKTKDEFNTEKGLIISEKIEMYNKELELSYSYGPVYNDYYLENSDYYNRDKSSLLVLIEDSILPNLKMEFCDNGNSIDYNYNDNINNDNDNNRMIIINTGAIRYDLYSGNYTKNSKFTISPFKNKWKIIKNIPIDISLELINYLNEDHYYMNLLNSFQRENNIRTTKNGEKKTKKHTITRGYVTEDDFGDEGDDTVHFKSPIYKIPNVINSFEIKDEDNKYIDLVFYDFIEGYIIQGLKSVSGDNNNKYEWTKNSEMYNNCTDYYKLSDLIQYEIEKGSGI